MKDEINDEIAQRVRDQVENYNRRRAAKAELRRQLKAARVEGKAARHGARQYPREGR